MTRVEEETAECRTGILAPAHQRGRMIMCLVFTGFTFPSTRGDSPPKLILFYRCRLVFVKWSHWKAAQARARDTRFEPRYGVPTGTHEGARPATSNKNPGDSLEATAWS